MKGRSRSSSTPTKRSSPARHPNAAKKWTKAAALRELKELADPKVRAKLAYFGVNVPKAYDTPSERSHRNKPASLAPSDRQAFKLAKCRGFRPLFQRRWGLS